MEKQNKLIAFEGAAIRKTIHNGEWYFSVVDIIEVLTDSPIPRNYWSIVKKREPQLHTICMQLKMQSKDGKFYKTDCANTEGVLRIVMSVPSPKAEPLKLWLAQVGRERIEEAENPEIAFERAREIYKAKGYPDDWIGYREKSILIRKELTDEWKQRGITENKEYSILTAEISKATFGVTPSEHAQLKGLEKQNLRDHMTNLELIFSALGEELTRTEAIKSDAQGFTENREAAMKGGMIAGEARERVEARTGQKVLSNENFLNLNADETKALPKNEEE
ncbi:MAG: Bro-N domain-containing protein [Saprospiraceae bacterium]|nr:Bro-N domain-containing protein [Saprospiraceae bacterium]